MIIKSHEKILIRCKYTSDYSLGDKVLIIGNSVLVEDDYKKYLSNNNIYNVVDVYSIKIINKNRNIFFIIKNIIYKRINNNRYLSTFLMGDKSLIDGSVKRSYQCNGISHLFSISGMHIALLSSILDKILRKKFSLECSFKITCIFLVFYLLIVGLYPSILRGVLFYILFKINNIYYFYIKKENIFLMILSISLLVNPKYIYDIAFWYSYLISFSLIRCSEYLTGNYIISLLKVSILSFIVSIPISIYNNYEINIFSIVYNLFYVPLVSIIIFPLTLITFIFRFLEPIYNLLIVLLESSSLLLCKITIGKLLFKKVFIGIYVLYIILVLLYLIFRKRVFIIIYFIILIIHLLIPYFDWSNYVEYFDVNQGDSILIHLGNKNILIDTGGEKDYFYSNLYLLLKSKGIKKIDYLILSHGDYDHMGDASKLVDSFKINKVIFNCGEFNYLEKELIQKLDNYYSCIDGIKVNSKELLFLNTIEYDNENDNSIVIYMEIDDYDFIFMGDASITTEKEIMNKYNLPNIDVLKVGHHGSKTSSSKEFINEISPKYSVISVGKNNRYGHPNKEVLDNLNDSKIYRTDKDGSIMFKIKNNKLKIETCSS